MESYKNRRQKVADSMAEQSILLLPSAELQFRNHDTERPFRQNSDFYYLSGLKEYDALIVLIKADNKITSILFSQPKDKQKEIWTGPRIGQAIAKDQYLFDETYVIDDINEYLPALLADKENIYYPIGEDKIFDAQIIEWLNKAKQSSREANAIDRKIMACSHLIHPLRLIKSEEELILMRKAAEVSAHGHRQLMQTCQPGMFEYELAAEFSYYCSKRGCYELAYPVIVGGGNNGCILHYTDNNQELKSNDLVLIDAGSEYEYYAADITRTFPVNGKFSEAQAKIYNLVLEAQLAGMAEIVPGNPWPKIQETIVNILVNGLLELGILKGKAKERIDDKSYQDFYMHNSGHWLGLDVHDVGGYKTNGEWRTLQPGMVLTIEPGIYIDPNNQDVDAKWRGIAVRIEDDVLVTETGHEVLTSAVPKTIEEIETLMNG